MRFDGAISSVLLNSAQPFEILIVCDGPLTPELNAVIEKFEDDEKFRIIRLDVNRGIVHALNAGLHAARCEYVIRCDSDDRNHTNRFSQVVSKLEEGFSVVGSQIQEVDKDNNLLPQKLVPTSHEKIVAYSRYRNPINHMSVGFRRSHVLSVGGYPEIHLKEDYALWVKLLSAGRRFVNIDKALVSASAGAEMHARRGGIRAAWSEIKLQKLLVNSGISSLLHAVIYGALRSSFLLTPLGLRTLAYGLVLRKRNKGSM